ncbi:MAG: histidine kinase, partial [Bacteroidota bacterium]
NFLRAQINPHLLFNTLNMFYGAAQEKSEELPDMMLGLANAMRYALQDGNRKRVFLQREIGFLHDYVKLQELRLEGRAQVSFVTHTADLHLQVPPLLFIVLVENAFKYASDHHVDGIVINLRLEVKRNQLCFRTENNIGDALAGSGATGLGLANLRQRLALIYGDQSASLHTMTAGHLYIAELTLPLEFAPLRSNPNRKKSLFPT